MIKTLRITSVAAVGLAAVVLASVLGFLRPETLGGLNFGARSDKQTEKILSGPSAVERYNEKHGNKDTDKEDTTPPLVKQAEIFANIINPPVPGPVQATVSSKLPPRPVTGNKPPVAVSSKFELLGTCCSSDPKASLACIRLPDNNQQWVRVGSEIGHVTIKEIRNGSIVCWDGTTDSEMLALAAPETSSLLETGKAPKDAAGLKAQASSAPATPNRGPNAKPQAINAASLSASPVKPAVSLSQATAVGGPAASAQFSKEEQENLSQLGNRLKAGAAADPNTPTSGSQSAVGAPLAPGTVPNPVDSADTSKNAWKDKLKEDNRRQQLQKRLAPPRSMKK